MIKIKQGISAGRGEKTGMGLAPRDERKEQWGRPLRRNKWDHGRTLGDL